MHATEWSEEGAQSRASTLTTVAVYFPHAITIVIAHPLVLSMIDCCMLLLDPVVGAVLVGIDDRSVSRDSFGQNALAARLVAMPDQWAALFARLTANDMNEMIGGQSLS